jgi:hypothetical protein
VRDLCWDGMAATVPRTMVAEGALVTSDSRFATVAVACDGQPHHLAACWARKLHGRVRARQGEARRGKASAGQALQAQPGQPSGVALCDLHGERERELIGATAPGRR